MSPRRSSPARLAVRVVLALGIGLAGLLVAVSPGASDSGEGAVVAAAKVQRTLSLGTEHTCAITDSGAVQCWGDNQFGQLGTGDTATSTRPQLVSGLTGALEVAAGNGSTCALVHGGSVKCWGLNSSGQLGHPPGYADSPLPVPVAGVTGATRLVSGDFHACALVSGGAVRCWGQDGMGQLGDGDPGDYTNQAVEVEGLPAADPVVDLAAGQWHTCARTAAKKLYCWGHNGFGQLGDGTDDDHAVAALVLDPQDVSSQAGAELSKVLAVTAGAGHTCAVVDVSGGAVACWGQNNFGQLGHDTAVESGVMKPSLEPLRVEEDTDASPFSESDADMAQDVRAVSAGSFHTCASGTNNSVWCWGQGDHGQLGYDGKPTPPGKKGYLEGSRWARPVPGLSAAGVVAGGFHTCSVGGGDLKCWGYDFHGQLGGHQSQVATPTVVTAVQGASKVAVGTSFACALLTTEPGDDDPDTAVSPYCWGDNDNGRLGTTLLSPTEETTVRVPVAGFGTASEIRAGNGTACVLPDGGGPRRCWGLNASGEIGDLSQLDRPTPVPSANLAGTGQYDLGGTLSGSERGTTCRVVAGNATCWGYNGQGQLGNGTTTDSLSPVTVLHDADPGDEVDPQPLPGVTAVAAGGDHACAIVGGGQVRCWGANGAGQLGDNTTDARQYAVVVQEDTDADPDEVDPLSGATALVAGDSHTCALISGGEVRCWGLGSSGQLGRSGSGLQADLPVKWQPPPPAVGTDELKTVTRLVSGDDHTCGLRTDQSLVCWGENDENQLGAGSGDSNLGLVTLEKPDVSLSEPWIRDLAAGRTNTCAVMLDRTVFCWGDNTHGQVGDGIGLHSVAPVDVGGSATFAQNEIPEPPDLLIETTPDTAATIPVSLAGMDPDGGTVSLTGVGTPETAGTSAFTATPATITYTPTTGSGCHDDRFSYTVSDGTAAVDGTVRVDMNCAPVAEPDTATVAEDGTVLVDVLANDHDADPGDTLTLAAVQTDTPRGTASVESGKVRYTPDADVCSPPPDAFGYTLDDGHGHQVTGVLTVTITCAGDGPAAGADVTSTPEETPVVINVLGNDGDADGDGLSVVGVSGAAHGTTSTNGTTVRYVPEADFCDLDSFTYTVSDGGTTATGTVSVTVTCADDSPRAVDDTASTPEDTSVLVDVLANDTDPDPDPDTLSLGALGSPGHGTVAVESGKVRYTPAADYCGPDSFTYVVEDETSLPDTGRVEVSVGCRNDAPVAVPDTASTPEDTTVHVHVVVNDLDVDGNALTLDHVGAAGHGTTAGAINNAVAYTPDPNYCGPDSFTYRVKDPAGETSTAVVSLTVVCVGDPTTLAAVGDTSVRWGDPLSVPLSATDPDGPTTLSVVSAPAGVAIDGSSVTWTPTSAQVGPHTITVRASDGTSSAQRSFVVSVSKRSTVLAYTGSVSGQVSDPFAVSAVLTDATTGFPVAGRSVSFSLGGASTTGSTGPGGSAAGTLLASAPLGARVVNASFGGDPAYTGSTAARGFTVGKESAAIALGGTPHVTTTGASATVVWTALLTEEQDGALSDSLAGTAVSFKRLDGSTVCTASAVRTAAGKAQATCSASQSVGALPVVVAGTAGNYVMNVDVGVVTVAGSGAGFASGAGRVGSDDFGFQARPVRKAAPTGNLVHAWVDGSSVRVVSAPVLDLLTTSCSKTTPKVCPVRVRGTAPTYASVDLVTGGVTTTTSTSTVTVDAVDPGRYAVQVTGGASRTLGSPASPLALDFGAVKVTP